MAAKDKNRPPAPVRILLMAALVAAAFWVGNVSWQYVMQGLPSMTLSAGAPEAPSVWEFLKAAFMARPLGISTDRMPMSIGAMVALFALVGANLGRGRVEADIDISEVYGQQELASIPDRAVFEHASATPEWPCPPWCEKVEDDNIICTQNSKLASTKNPDYRIEQMCANRHVFIMGASGRGKTYTLVGPNILQLNGSFVISDPKCELFRMYSNFLRAHGYKVECLNLIDDAHIRASSRYNPLHYCDSINSINQCVLYFIENTKGEDHGGDKEFFLNMEKSFYTAVIGLFVYMFKANGNEDDCTMPALIDYLLMAKADGVDGASKLDVVFNGDPSVPDFPSFRRYIVEHYRRGEDVLYDQSLPEVAVLNAYEMFKMNAGDLETMSNVISSCAARLSKLNDPSVRAMLSRDELELDRMGCEKRAIFLGVKAEGGPNDYIVSMALNQLFDRNIAAAIASPTGHVDVPIWCWLDELANIGKVPNLSRLFAIARSYWINLIAIVQDGQQLEARYGKDAKSIISNSAVFIFLGSPLMDDCELVSKMLGKTTRIQRKVSRTTSNGSTSVTESFEPVSVDLMSPAELYNWDARRKVGFDPSKCLTHYFGSNWFMDDKFDLKTHRRYAELADAGDADFMRWGEERDAERLVAERRSLPAAGETHGELVVDAGG